jgi:translation initiation factor IF-3
VSVPRRFDRRPPERDTTRINDRIRVPEVRLIDDEGNQVGVLKIADALAFAQERELDLVEVAPEARPPVARVLDYSKYKYEQAQKQKQARKHQQQITVREIKFRPKIAEHDYDTKKSHVERFLRHRDKVKITIMFRGREVTHPERGTAILDRLAGELAELAVVEQHPTQEGRNMTMMMAPSKAVLAGRLDAASGSNGGAASEASTVAPNGGSDAVAGASRADANSADASSADANSADASSTDASSADASSAEADSADASSASAGSADAGSASANSRGGASRTSADSEGAAEGAGANAAGSAAQERAASDAAGPAASAAVP